jgi:hypothetical protein
MTTYQSLCDVLESLVETLELQGAEIERIATHLEQQTRPLTPPIQMASVLSELSNLHDRVRDLGTPLSVQSLK